MAEGIFEEPASGLPAIAERGPAAAREAVRETLRAAGVSFSSVNGDAEFLVDPVPRVIAAGEWEVLERGLAQRALALNRFLADAYGPREIVAEGVMEARVIETAPGYEPRMRGVRVPGGVWVGVAGLDLVREPSGRFLVLEDNATTPSGFGYAVAARDAILAALPPAERPRSIAAAADLLAGALHAVSPVERPATRSCSPTGRTTPPTGSTRGRPSSSGSRWSAPATWRCAASACTTAVSPSTSSTGARTPTGSTPTSGACCTRRSSRADLAWPTHSAPPSRTTSSRTPTSRT